MPDTPTRFDAIEHLDTPEDHVELLNAALATGDLRIVVNALSEIGRGRGMAALAKQSGIGRSTLHKALADDGNPTIDTIMKVMDALKIDLTAGTKRVSTAAAA